MANLTHNRINTVLTSTEIAEIKQDIERCKAKIPEIGMTPEEYKSFRSMDVANKVLVEDALMLLRQNGSEIMPSYINIPNIEADFQLFEDLDVLKTYVKSLLTQIETVQRIVAKEALDNVKTVYRQYGIAADAGIPNAKVSYDQLSSHFKDRKGRNTDKL